jgi:hypothetical protein
MVMWPLPQNHHARTRLLVHESFHRVQNDRDPPGSNPLSNRLDGKDGCIWLRLEWRALSEGLIRQGTERKRAVEDALIFRAYRRSIIPQAAAQENALEMNEGVAEYTGSKLCGWPDAIQADRAAVRLESDGRGGSFIRSFAYASGPAYGALLDEAGAAWRTGLRPDSDFGALLTTALGITLPADLAQAARARAGTYEGPTVFAEETTREDEQKAADARNQEKFVDGPVLVLPLSPEVNYSFSPMTVQAFGEHGTVYGATRVVDHWGILEVEQGALMVRDASGRATEFHVTVPTGNKGVTYQGEGWTLTLNPGWTVKAGKRIGDFEVGQ